MNLSGRRALVTGSSQGIGLAIAESLAEQGCAIILHGLASREQFELAIEQVRRSGAAAVEVSTADLSDPDAIADMMTAAGEIDILVNNAGVQQTGAFGDLTTDIWDRILAVNLTAAFHTMRLALPGMAGRGFGRVVNIASVHGLVASRNKAPYVASKFGLVGLTKAAALEYAACGSASTGGVTVNCLCPGWTDTPLIGPQVEARARALGASGEDAVRSLLSEKQPSGRMSAASEIANFAVWMCDPQAHNLTGAAIPIDGAWTAQ